MPDSPTHGGQRTSADRTSSLCGQRARWRKRLWKPVVGDDGSYWLDHPTELRMRRVSRLRWRLQRAIRRMA